MTPQAELALDIVQFTLDLAGIVDPTPISDGASALMSLGRRQWVSSAISAVSMVPYIGDLAKLGKLQKYSESVTKAVRLAATDPQFAAALRPALERLKTIIEKVPLNALPEAARGQVDNVIRAVNAFLHAGSAATKSFKPFADVPSFAGRPIGDVLAWLRRSGFEEVQSPAVSSLGKTRQSQIWFRRHPQPDGTQLIEAIRIDARGHSVSSRIAREGTETHRFATVNVASGEPRHMHKELIDSAIEAAYKNGGIKRNGKHWTPPSFDDMNQVAAGHQAAHIRLVP
jgi:hypothetical protein